ncbi:ATP-dependent RNA helicase HrpA [Aliikangiella sp. G2MR2-5]|uniref:ATP-dependent RNA helicase HrpA n=1 Tax=Aliikangiella sp. G2MR2-5 TaxID=2788943 RepID=UPI001AED2C79|nr:ATP-dependent RNA helicase HrpA [Aliikangiella sp. G2MR2-5]
MMDLSQIQCRDIPKVKKLASAIQARKKKGLAADQLDEKLKQLLEKSKARTDANRIGPEKLNIPSDLPIAHKAAEIVQLLQTNQVVVVAGETGCGKTTQLPKICVRAGFGRRGLIAHTQPRRVAATSVARRIAEEMSTPLGEAVGYSIRFNSKVSNNTRIKLMTDGVLLSEIEQDPLLLNYEVIIIDEAHERSLNIDFLLGFLRKILKKRKELRIIITSATIDPEKFAIGFGGAPIVEVEGRSYPVEVRYRPFDELEESGNDDPLLLGIANAVDECFAESSGNILIFADGEGQIKSIINHLKKLNLSGTELLPLYARLSINEQQRIFKDSGKRKIIVSTNVAETSLTVPGIIFVIDIGTARISRFSQRSKILQLPVEKVSRASADQRKGRCGRIAPGICIRLYSEEDFQSREEFTPPEIRRTNLASVVLRLKALGVAQVENFPFIESPSERAWRVAFNSLFELGAIDKEENITKIGRVMAKLPVDPQLARILADPGLAAVNEMLIICSLMSVKEVRMRPHDKQQKADQLHSKYNQKNSDILTAINLWNTLEEEKSKLSSNQFKVWCNNNLINFLGWLEWRRVYFQLKEAVEQIGVKVSQGESHEDEVHKALVPGFISHIFIKTQEIYYQGPRGLKVWVHPSSLAFKKSLQILLSAEMIETEKLYARMNCPIKAEWIEQYATHLMKSNYMDIHWRKSAGQVSAFLNQSLLGIPVVNRRLVDYSSVDPEKAREIFLHDGLASGEVKADFPFLKANLDKLKTLEAEEHKLRQENIRIDQKSLASLYSEKLPEHIVSITGLRKWLRKDFKKRNRDLSFSIEALRQNLGGNEEDFPSVIEVRGVELNVKYTFAPGSQEDGVSVLIPPVMVNQFNEKDFDWLVPGYLEEKVTASIKSLPKVLRKRLIPIKETAQKCVKELYDFDKNSVGFFEALSQVLQRILGEPVSTELFDSDSLPQHLKMKYLPLASGKANVWQSLEKLKATQVSKKGTSLNTISDLRTTSWNFKHFEIEKVEKIKGVESRIFQALVDRGTAVVTETFATKCAALRAHKLGVARLLILENHTLVNKLFNSWPDKVELERLCIRFDGFRALFDILCLSCARQLVGETVIDQQKVFSQASEHFAQTISGMMSELLNEILPLIRLREKVYSQISALNEKIFSQSIKDMREQLRRLWSKELLLSVEKLKIDDYQRYHRGIMARIKRINENYPKEKAALDIWQEWWNWWLSVEKLDSENRYYYDAVRLFWMLEEYRISLFSHGIKTKGGISAKKLQNAFEEFESFL